MFQQSHVRGDLRSCWRILQDWLSRFKRTAFDQALDSFGDSTLSQRTCCEITSGRAKASCRDGHNGPDESAHGIC